MENNKINLNELPAELFERVPLDLSMQEKIERPSLTFWADARRRLFKNRGAVAGMVILAILVLMAFIGPMMNEYTYSQQIQPLKENAKLPPRIPGIEKLGIFDGTLVKEIGKDRLDAMPTDQYKIIEEVITVEEGVESTRYKIKEYTYIKQGASDRYFWFGTDELARDIWTRTWKGTQVSLYIGMLSALLDMVIGLTYGAISGFYGGKVDIFMMRFIEVLSGIPSLVVIVLFLLVMEPGIFPMSLAIAITSWEGMARVVRGQFLKLKNQEFVLAARTLGTSNTQLITRHLLPNVIGQVIVMITFTIPGAIFYEAFLAFIGLGIPAPNASLGVLVSESRSFLRFIPSMMLIPATVISVLMLSINLFANGLRDALDPRMRNQ
jgi:oligopeptide transport system permease protein